MWERILLLGALLVPGQTQVTDRRSCVDVPGTLYDFNSTLLDEVTPVSLSDYAGKVVLVYNVATYWGLTTPSYQQINALAEAYAGTDLVILGWPCNQFGKQEPAATEEELRNGIQYVRPGGGFIPKLTLFHKIDVNGENEDPIFTFLKSACDYTDLIFNDSIFYSPKVIGDINWNFEKFLVGRDGKPYSRYHPRVINETELMPDIDYLLAQQVPVEF